VQATPSSPTGKRNPLLPRRFKEIAYEPDALAKLHCAEHRFVEVCIRNDKLHSLADIALRRPIWGDSVQGFTADSNILLAIVHSGYLPCRCTDPSYRWPPELTAVRAVLELQDALPWYPRASRNGVDSRAWASRCFQCSYRVARVWAVEDQVRLFLACNSRPHALPT
jgi:hypothetical protein